MIDPLADIAIRPAIAALPKADVHLHSEAGPRLEQVIAELPACTQAAITASFCDDEARGRLLRVLSDSATMDP